MKNLSTEQLLEVGDALANDFVTFAQEHGISGRDLLLAVAIGENMLHKAIATPKTTVEVIQEAAATVAAVSGPLGAN